MLFITGVKMAEDTDGTKCEHIEIIQWLTSDGHSARSSVKEMVEAMTTKRFQMQVGQANGPVNVRAVPGENPYFQTAPGTEAEDLLLELPRFAEPWPPKPEPEPEAEAEAGAEVAAEGAAT